MSELDIYKGMVKKMKNDEIKEILKFLKVGIDKLCISKPDFSISYNDVKILLDYITNLQQKEELFEKIVYKYDELKQENERLKRQLNCKEYFSSTMPKDTEFVILTKNNYDRQQKDIQLELIDYKSRCEKAVEYIKINFVEDIITVKTLLNILNGRSDE